MGVLCGVIFTNQISMHDFALLFIYKCYFRIIKGLVWKIYGSVAKKHGFKFDKPCLFLLLSKNQQTNQNP